MKVLVLFLGCLIFTVTIKADQELPFCNSGESYISNGIPNVPLGEVDQSFGRNIFDLLPIPESRLSSYENYSLEELLEAYKEKSKWLIHPIKNNISEKADKIFEELLIIYNVGLELSRAKGSKQYEAEFLIEHSKSIGTLGKSRDEQLKLLSSAEKIANEVDLETQYLVYYNLNSFYTYPDLDYVLEVESQDFKVQTQNNLKAIEYGEKSLEVAKRIRSTIGDDPQDTEGKYRLRQLNALISVNNDTINFSVDVAMKNVTRHISSRKKEVIKLQEILGKIQENQGLDESLKNEELGKYRDDLERVESELKELTQLRGKVVDYIQNM